MEKDSVTMTFHSLMNTICLQEAYNKLGEFSTLFGPFHKDGNHWTLVVVDIEKSELLYIDPLAAVSEHRKKQRTLVTTGWNGHCSIISHHPMQ